ncbi:MAG: hypothetical protein JXA67_00855, partial [Micromonosporaceae bacterium]|nr:hypothetical protein [Micromonosporaceae bacterium]
FSETYLAQAEAVLDQLGEGFAQYPARPTLTDAGRIWAGAVEQHSGGTRPGFAEAFSYWNALPMVASMRPALTSLPFMLGMYPGVDGGALGSNQGNLAGNTDTFYRLHDGEITTLEVLFNLAMMRVSRTIQPQLPDPAVVPGDGAMDTVGRPGVPVLALTGIGDLLTPLSLPQQYARRISGNGQSDLLVARAVRGVAHCEYTQAETERAFSDLVAWAEQGARPAGDDLLDPEAVADPAFGCRFTEGDHAGWTEPCVAPAVRNGERKAG